MVLRVAKSSVDDKKRKLKVPQIEITNKGNADKYVNGIELTFDSYFSTKGIVEIVIGDKVILDGNNAEDFRQYKLLTIPVNSEILKREKSIKIFVWNPTDDDIVKFSANISLEESVGNSNLSGVPSDPDQITRHVSGSESENNVDSKSSPLFEHKVYRDETIEKLLNMNGNCNLIVTMSASEIILPTITVGDDIVDTTGQFRIYDTHNNNGKN